MKKCVALPLRPQTAIMQRFITSRWLQRRSDTRLYLGHLRPAQPSIQSYFPPTQLERNQFQLRSDCVFPQTF